MVIQIGFDLFIIVVKVQLMEVYRKFGKPSF